MSPWVPCGAKLPGWLLTTMAADTEQTSLQISRSLPLCYPHSPPPTHTPRRLVQFEAASRHSVLAEKLKDLSRENLYTSSERYPNLPRQLALALSAWSGMRGAWTGFPGSRVERGRAWSRTWLGFALPNGDNSTKS